MKIEEVSKLAARRYRETHHGISNLYLEILASLPPEEQQRAVDSVFKPLSSLQKILICFCQMVANFGKRVLTNLRRPMRKGLIKGNRMGG